MLHGNDDIASLVPFLDIPVRLGCLFERKGPVDHCFELPLFDEAFDQQRSSYVNALINTVRSNFL